MKPVFRYDFKNIATVVYALAAGSVSGGPTGKFAQPDSIPQFRKAQKTREVRPCVILFTGHRIDGPDRQQPRFPPDREDQARAMIMAAVSEVQEKLTGELLGIAGGASGGDILFHEVCAEMDIPTRMYLALPQSDYIRASVADAGPGWVERFNRLSGRQAPEVLSEAGEPLGWSRVNKDFSVWQRANLWMLDSALAIAGGKLTLVALWNGAVGDGPGGTADMIRRAQSRGATVVRLDARKLVG